MLGSRNAVLGGSNGSLAGNIESVLYVRMWLNMNRCDISLPTNENSWYQLVLRGLEVEGHVGLGVPKSNFSSSRRIYQLYWANPMPFCR